MSFTDEEDYHDIADFLQLSGSPRSRLIIAFCEGSIAPCFSQVLICVMNPWQKRKIQDDQTYSLISRSIKLATKTLF